MGFSTRAGRGTATAEPKPTAVETNATPDTPTETLTETPATNGASPTKVVDPDRGNIGVVSVVPDTEDWGAVRTRSNNNPIHIAVRDAVKGTSYAIVAENDPAKIERVKRMLRAAAQRFDVGMSIHPEVKPLDDQPDKVKVRFKTGDRDHRAKSETPEPDADKTPQDTDATPGQ